MTTTHRIVLPLALVCLATCERGKPTSTSPTDATADATQTTGEEAEPEPEAAEPEPPPDPGPPVVLTAVAQHAIGPTSQWRFDPDGKFVAWKNEDQCGLWLYASGQFAGYFPRMPDDPCERWPKGLRRFGESKAVAPDGSGATATVAKNHLKITGADKAVVLDVECPSCQRYAALAWSPDARHVAVSRSARGGVWGVDVWSLDGQLVDQFDVDLHGKEEGIELVWTGALHVFVSHAYDPNEGHYDDEDFGLEDYEYVHGPALSVLTVAAPQPANNHVDKFTEAREVRAIGESIHEVVVDPLGRAMWTHIKDEDPRAFGHSWWTHVSLGAEPGVGGELKPRDSVSPTLSGEYADWRWVERPYDILESWGYFYRQDATGKPRYSTHELLGIGASGHAEGSPWLDQRVVWTNHDDVTHKRRRVGLDGLGISWSELHGLSCTEREGEEIDESRDCQPFGGGYPCELVDFSPDGKRMLGSCGAGLSLLERDGTKLLELSSLAPSELRWRWVDEDTLALLGDDRKLLLISVAGASVRETIDDVRQIYPLTAGGDFGLLGYRTGDTFVVRSVDNKRRFERKASVFAAAIDPTGEHVAVTDLKVIQVFEIASGDRVASFRASKIRKLGYRQDGAVLFGTQVRERGPTRAWDAKTGAEREDALPASGWARWVADNPSWRWGWNGEALHRVLDGRKLYFDEQSAMLDNGLYQGDVPRALNRVLLRRGDTLDAFVLYDAVDLAPALRREGLADAFLAGEALPEVVVGEYEIERLLATAAERRVPSAASVVDEP